MIACYTSKLAAYRYEIDSFSVFFILIPTQTRQGIAGFFHLRIDVPRLLETKAAHPKEDSYSKRRSEIVFFPFDKLTYGNDFLRKVAVERDQRGQASRDHGAEVSAIWAR